MPYTVHTTAIDGVLMLEPKVFGDARGFFFESFNAHDFAAATGVELPFVQDNHSRSAQGVLRGLHYQIPPMAQAKLVRVVQGEVFDVAVDIEGHVYVAAGDIFVYDKTGKQIDMIKVPERPSTMVFGGKDKKTLFITARSSLYSVKTKFKGR